ncbi:hypothetical protein ABXS75_04080 [Roseburia hominis]
MIKCKYSKYDRAGRELTSEIMPVCDVVSEGIEKGEFPFFIAHEYSRLYDMVEKKQIAGALFEIKDVFEVMLKFPILLGLALIVRLKEEGNGKTYEIMSGLVVKELTLGDWEKLAKKLNNILYDMEETEETEVIRIIIEKTLCFYEGYEVVSWRNDMIGHGALPFENDISFIERFIHIAYGITECLEQSFEQYRVMQLYCGNKLIRSLEDIEQSSGNEVMVEMNGNTRISMGDFVINKKYFFDGFYWRILKSYCLDYIEGKREKKDIERFRNLYKCTKKELGNHSSVDNPVIQRGLEESLRSLNSSENYFEFKSLNKWFKKQIGKKKGIFLLQMDRGMGKTAFVANLDPLQRKSNNTYYDCCIRVYYCNELSYRSADEFVEAINQLFKLNRDRSREISRENFMRLKPGDTGKQLALVLGDILNKIHHVESDIRKLILVIDGLDEIYPSTDSIFQYIPSEEELPDNVYILLTCRNEDGVRLNEFTKTKLDDIKKNKIKTEDGILNIPLKDEKNINHLKKYIKARMVAGIIDKKTELWNEGFQEEILKASEYRFLYAKLVVDLLIECRNKNIDYRMVFNSVDVMGAFLKYIESQFGTKLFKEAFRILLIIATEYVPLTLKEICFLSEGREGGIPAYVLAVLKTFDSILMTVRTPRGTCYKLANAEYKKKLTEKSQEQMKELIDEWKRYILCTNIGENAGYVDKSIYENSGEMYLTAHLYQYIQDYFGKVWGSVEEINRLCQVIMKYENHLPAIQKGVRVQLWDMQMTESVIIMLEKLKREGHHYDKQALALAYSNYAYHYADVQRAEADKEKIITYYNNAIKEMEHNEEISEGKKKITLSRFYSGKGVFLNKYKENIEEIEKIFLKSYMLCLEAMEAGEVTARYSYLLSVIRVLDIYGVRKFGEAVDLFYSAAKRTSAIKKQYSKEKKVLIYNTDNRIESGILFQEAQLYRKMANIAVRSNTVELNADELFRYAVTCMEELIGYEVKREEVDRVNKDRWVIIFEYSRYLYEKNDIEAAEEGFDQALRLIDDLVKKEKLEMKGNRYLKELMQLWCNMKETKEMTETTKGRVQMYRRRLWEEC